ncbi:MAG TPA: NAD(P)H-hydrate dehydratase [Burkholderiales bacterium]
MTLPTSLYSAAQVRELDRRAIETHGIPGAELMQRAGAAVYEALRVRFPRARRIAVVCGPGNNGGDGYVVARLAKEAGLEVSVLTLGRPPAANDAAAMRVQAEAAGVPIAPFAASGFAGVDVIVDALLGTGLQRDVEGEWRGAIEAINASGRPVIAVDVPSGLNADTGAVMGAAVRASLTVSFIGLKAGVFTGDGPDHAGAVLFDDLGVPSAVYENLAPLAHRLAPEELRELVHRRPRNAHKGSFGHVLVVGGGRGMPGAARLCGEAALRAGAGLVTLAVHPENAAAAAARPELLVYGIRSAEELAPLFARATVVALGPGLGTDAWARSVWEAALAAGRPLVVDADALNLLAESPRAVSDAVLTPHPGEAARLLASSSAAVQRDRFAAARALVARYRVPCVLKGAGSLVACEDRVWLCDRGNPGMASAGMGDVLTGVVAALRAQGLSAPDAARLGVWLHAAAGDDAAGDGEAGLIASDLYPHLRARLRSLTDVDPPA